MEEWVRRLVGLPPSPDNVSRETCSPDPRDVSRETFRQGIPSPTTPTDYIGDMEEATAHIHRECGVAIPPLGSAGGYDNNMDNDTMPTATAEAPTLTTIMNQLVSLIVTQVTQAVKADMEDMVDDKLSEYDPTDAYEFSSAVEETVSDYISNLTFTVTVD